jgi:CheY-like chemotaxis protein
MASALYNGKQPYQNPYGTKLSGRQWNILVVDDDYEMANYILGCLTSNLDNVNVEVVGSGAEVLKKFKEKAPDILLSDIAMPGMDCFEMLMKLEKMEALSDVKTLLITGKEFSYTDLMELKKFQITGMLFKPFDSQKLVARVQKIIENFEE